MQNGFVIYIDERFMIVLMAAGVVEKEKEGRSLLVELYARAPMHTWY